MANKPWATIDAAWSPDAIAQVWPEIASMSDDALEACVKEEAFAPDVAFTAGFSPTKNPADAMAIIEAISAIDLQMESLHWGGLQHNWKPGMMMPYGGIFESATWYSFVTFAGWPLTIVNGHIGRLMCQTLLFIVRMAEHLQVRAGISKAIADKQAEKYKAEIEKANQVIKQTFMEQEKLKRAATIDGPLPKKWSEKDVRH